MSTHDVSTSYSSAGLVIADSLHSLLHEHTASTKHRIAALLADPYIHRTILLPLQIPQAQSLRDPHRSTRSTPAFARALRLPLRYLPYPEPLKQWCTKEEFTDRTRKHRMKQESTSQFRTNLSPPPSALAKRITDGGNELIVIERLHEKCDWANGHGRGARGQIFTRSDDDRLCAR